MDIQSVWEKTLQAIQPRIGTPAYFALIQGIKPLHMDEETLTLEAPNSFIRGMLESRHGELLREIVSTLLEKQNVRIEFTVSPRQERLPLDAESKTAAVPVMATRQTAMNPRYTFDTFVVGNSNRLAHAASRAVAGSPAKAYNPLFIYGGVGLGKTHLMQAVGHYCMENHKNVRVSYFTSEKFTNDLIRAIREHSTEEFRNKYRNIDILLIDDIQFLIGKEQTQEEFFHTFNTLYGAEKQIVISSDRPPKELVALEERLRSRFNWGLIADIQTPDFETRLAILEKKAEAENIVIPEDVLAHIAKEIPSNIRNLEGALTRLIAKSSIYSIPITISLTDEVLKDFLPDAKKKAISIAKIQEAVCDYFHMNPQDLFSARRHRSLSYPRQVAMFICRELTQEPFERIGDEFGKRDHTTVMHACDKISQKIKEDPHLEKRIQEIKARLRSG